MGKESGAECMTCIFRQMSLCPSSASRMAVLKTSLQVVLAFFTVVASSPNLSTFLKSSAKVRVFPEFPKPWHFILPKFCKNGSTPPLFHASCKRADGRA